MTSYKASFRPHNSKLGSIERERAVMEHLILIVASLILTTQTGTGQQRGPDLSVLSARIEVVADYAADARAGRTAARSTSLPVDQWESGAAFDRLDAMNDRGVGKKYRVSVVVRNDGPRAIRAVTCEYPLAYSGKSGGGAGGGRRDVSRG